MRPIDYAKQMCETKMRQFPEAKDLPPTDHFHYHQGVFLSGMEKCNAIMKEERYIDYIKAWVDYNINSEGIVERFRADEMDDIQPGRLLYDLYDKTGDTRYVKALHELVPLIYNFKHNPDGGIWHKEVRTPHQMWLDGLYMGGPIMAEYAARFKKPEYTDFVIKQILIMESHTYDPETGLLYHAYDDAKVQPWCDPETGKSPEFWGRSIGWVPVAVLDDLEFIPEDHPKRNEVIRMVTQLLQNICKYQDAEDGRFYQVVNKGNEPGNWHENSCSCLFSAALFKAVRLGLLPDSYLENAKKAYEGVIRDLGRDGEDLLLDHVCVGTNVGDYDHYINRPVSVNDLHGLGAFLLMCAEAEKMMQ